MASVPDLDLPPVVAVVGSRDWPDIQRVRRYVEKLSVKHPGAVIVSGGARGVDRAAEETAFAVDLELISYRPYEYTNHRGWQEFSIQTFMRGPRATLIASKMRRADSPPTFTSYGQAAHHRNGWIAQDCDILVAFTIGSPGTARTIKVAREFGRQVFVYESG